jgi:hypothetical protein
MSKSVDTVRELNASDLEAVVDEDIQLVPARDVREGDMIDLEGDPFADDGQHPEHEFEFAIVEGSELETPECIRIDFDSTSVGFPPDHMLRRFVRQVGEDE